MEIKPKLISYRSAWQNGVTERWVGTLRRELLDHVVVFDEKHLHVVVFNEKHLQRLVFDDVRYYNHDRCHLSVEKDAPVARPVMAKPSPSATAVALPRVGGLHHRYEWRDDRAAA